MLLTNLTSYLIYFVSTLILLLVALTLYVKVLPYDEVALIRRGNVAAAVALGGAMIGYGAVVWSAAAHGSSLVETAIWSGVALVSQIIAFEIVHLVFRDFKAGMEKGELSYGIALGAFSVAVGIINAGCLTP
jgi:putative membrane protein